MGCFVMWQIQLAHPDSGGDASERSQNLNTASHRPASYEATNILTGKKKQIKSGLASGSNDQFIENPGKEGQY